MIAELVLAALTGNGSQFLQMFSGVWTCGNAHYHERWEVVPHRGTDTQGAWMADVAYGDPQHPDGFAYVYFVPGANQFRYDDFHIDGSQSHLTAPPPTNGAWEWTGTYYPDAAAPDPGPDITWRLTPQGTIARTFAQRVNGKAIVRGSDTCTKQPDTRI